MTSEPAAASTVVPDDGRVYRFVVDPHHCFVCGELNRRGLRLPIYASAGRAWADLTLGRDFVGWTDIAHGGILAALLDEVMGWALFEHDCWGVTAEMTVRYVRPVDPGRPIHVEGEVLEVSRRLFRTAGRITDAQGTLLTSAEARYVAAPEARRAELKAQYRFRLEPVDGAAPA
ncbi:MAG: thioesterase superfamily protein [Chloroflexi bacterium CSP1-4]|nr:MAG: thioesterase superfamily protein [Chloroflexi bacterium CSP1-4]